MNHMKKSTVSPRKGGIEKAILMNGPLSPYIGLRLSLIHISEPTRPY